MEMKSIMMMSNYFAQTEALEKQQKKCRLNLMNKDLIAESKVSITI
jgi:hypothetical protein